MDRGFIVALLSASGVAVTSKLARYEIYSPGKR